MGEAQVRVGDLGPGLSHNQLPGVLGESLSLMESLFSHLCRVGFNDL